MDNLQNNRGELAIRVSMLPRDTNPGGTIFVGDVISFYTRTIKLGRTSVTVGVIVEAMRYRDSDQVVRVLEAEAVYVAVDEDRRPIPIKETGE